MNNPVLLPDEQKRIICELQDNLRSLANENNKIPLIPVDGIYSLDTKLAVKAFQKENGLEETGETDFATWNAIQQQVEQVRRSQSAAAPLAIFQPTHQIIRDGNTGDTVLCIQLMLRCIQPYLSPEDKININGSYGKSEKELIKAIQEIADIEPTGCVDIPTWNILTDLYSLFSQST